MIESLSDTSTTYPLRYTGHKSIDPTWTMGFKCTKKGLYCIIAHAICNTKYNPTTHTHMWKPSAKEGKKLAVEGIVFLSMVLLQQALVFLLQDGVMEQEHPPVTPGR